MVKAKTIEIIARGVLIKSGKLLLCHAKGARNTYLPGGHIDFGESAQAALVREIREEMGVKSRAKRFLGAVEHSYRRNGELQCEINLVFEIEAAGLKAGKNPVSKEDYIEFLWVELSGIDKSALEPSVLRGVISVWTRNKRSGTAWASTVR